MKHLLSFKLLMICLLASTVILGPGCKKDRTLDREKFLGAYNVNENCTSGNYNYAISITASSNSDDAVVISNFGDFGVNVRAVVSGSNININDTQGGYTFSGSGNISGNTLSLIYTASIAGNTDNCTQTCIKQ